MPMLSDGREVVYDLRKLSMKDYRAMFDPASKYEDEEATIARVTGLSVEELQDLTVYDHKLLWRDFFKTCRDPLKDADDPKV